MWFQHSSLFEYDLYISKFLEISRAKLKKTVLIENVDQCFSCDFSCFNSQWLEKIAFKNQLCKYIYFFFMWPWSTSLSIGQKKSSHKWLIWVTKIVAFNIKASMYIPWILKAWSPKQLQCTRKKIDNNS